MGVHGLWELLAPVGRRVSVETLTGKKLAIDASIWMIQFMKAMRDEKGEMVRNAHILGFFRRICKLLYLRTKPVFVFDGGTPALKRRTVIARRRQRENAQAKIRKTAEKLLLNHLRAMRLKELAADLQKQRQENDIKGKRPMTQETNNVQHTEKGNDDAAIIYNQEELDGMLAASLAVEDSEGLSFDASTSGAAGPDEVFGDWEEDEDDDDDDDDDDEEEEIILPEMQGKIDPAVLAALPPSVQLDLLVQMRERLMAENRQKYQKVKKAPARFSELQIQAYLKTVAFRREIDGVQKSAAGRGIGGVQTARIASEANREFIFSSSFTGDKQVLTSVGRDRVETDQSQPPEVNCTTDAANEVLSTTRSSGAAIPTVVETGKALLDDVETYVDERGRLRISRVRALGIRMTRDLQRNLDLMKEIDQEKADTNQEINNESTTARNPVDVPDNASDRIRHPEITDKNNDGMNFEVDKIEEPSVVNGTSIEICFEDTLDHDYGNDDDKLFARLVAGDPVMDFSVDNPASAKESLHSASDCEWEEGVIEDKSKACMFGGGLRDEGEVEWEEGFQDIQLKSSPYPVENQKTVTKGALQEEADFQEAIRRSLEDTRGSRSMNDFHGDRIFERAKEMDRANAVPVYEGNEWTEIETSATNISQNTVTKGALQEEADFQEAVRRGLEDTRGGKSMNDFHEDHIFERAKEMVSEDTVPAYEGKEGTEIEASAADVSKKTVRKGALQEETDFQEAIRRSLEDTRGGRSISNFHEDHIFKRAKEMASEDAFPVCEGKEGTEIEAPAMDVSQPFFSCNILETNSSEAKSAAFINLNPDKSNLDLKLLNQDAGGSAALAGEILASSEAVPGEKEMCLSRKQPTDACSDEGHGHSVNKLMDPCSGEVVHNHSSSTFISSFTDSMQDRLLSADAQPTFPESLDDHSCNIAKLGKIAADDSITDEDGAKELAKEDIYGNFPMERENATRNSSLIDENKEHEILEDHLEKEMLFLDKVREELGSEQRKLERNAESVSSEMFAECQELLQMFGLPYIIAPMEAESQCAFMELSNLVDGVVTDDSDAFLFGARSVYKNIFDDRKYVETYFMKDIEVELGLDREKLIHMALLLGSDYTEGISGIGIVNAIEVVNAFPEKDGLREFREWIESPDPTILGTLDAEAGGNTRRKKSKDNENIVNGSTSNTEGISSDQNVPQPVDDAKMIKQIFMDKHRNVSKNWHIPSSFPSDAVIAAYASPQVDKTTEPFSWGKPDLFVLRKLCWEKFGWGTSKADDLLLPVLKEYNKHETQLRLEAFYTFNERFAKIRSKRIKKAVKGITGHKSSELMDDTTAQHSGSGRKRKVRPSKDEANQSGVCSTKVDGAGAGTSNQKNNKPTVKRSKGQMKEKTSQRNSEQSPSADSHLISRKESHVTGRQRGRGRGQLSGRGRRKKISSLADPESSHDDDSCGDSDKEMHFDRSGESRQLRRSGRLQKNVNYTVSDEFDNRDKESENSLEEGATTSKSLVDQAVAGVNASDGNELNEGTSKLLVDQAVAGVNASDGNELNEGTSKLLVDQAVAGINASDGNELNEGTQILMGSGLSLDVTEQDYRMDKMNPSRVDDPLNQSELSKDYLQLGGGFCLDEDEEMELDGRTIETIPDKSNVLNRADSAAEENLEGDPSTVIPTPSDGKKDLSDTELNMNNKRQSDCNTPDDTEDGTGNCCQKPLRAMPNLRRKKRKT